LQWDFSVVCYCSDSLDIFLFDNPPRTGYIIDVGREKESMILKTNCPACGKKKAIKHKVVFTPGDCVITTVGKGCYKCGWKPPDIP
tara:strand:+ start:2238 stop:2495 length:258 start_codon:yes stop_codon:yes gene_type:complete